MEQFEYKVVVYDTTGFWGGNVEQDQLEDSSTGSVPKDGRW